MLSAIVLQLRAAESSPGWSIDLGAMLRGAFYRLLGEVDPDLATAVHNWPRPGPLTLAPLTVPRGSELAVRVTLLDRELGALLSPVLLDLRGQRMRLGAVSTTVTAVIADPTGHPLAGARPLAELLDPAPARAWTFRFRTPTSFKSDRVTYPLPAPERLWSSWARRWNDFCPPEERLELSFLDAFPYHVQIIASDLKVGPTKLSGTALHGFLGTVTIELRRNPSDELRRNLSRLAAFSFWAGTGVKTTAGMGVTVPTTDGARTR